MIDKIFNYLFPYLMTFAVVAVIIIMINYFVGLKRKEIKPTKHMIQYNQPLWITQVDDTVAILFPFQYNETIRMLLRERYASIAYNGLMYDLSRVYSVEVRYHDGIPLRMCTYIYIESGCSPFDVFDDSGVILNSILFKIQGGIRCQSIDFITI